MKDVGEEGNKKEFKSENSGSKMLLQLERDRRAFITTKYKKRSEEEHYLKM